MGSRDWRHKDYSKYFRVSKDTGERVRRWSGGESEKKKQTKLERNKYVERDVKENFMLEEGDSIQSWNWTFQPGTNLILSFSKGYLYHEKRIII